MNKHLQIPEEWQQAWQEESRLANLHVVAKCKCGAKLHEGSSAARHSIKSKIKRFNKRHANCLSKATRVMMKADPDETKVKHEQLVREGYQS